MGAEKTVRLGPPRWVGDVGLCMACLSPGAVTPGGRIRKGWSVRELELGASRLRVRLCHRCQQALKEAIIEG